jgi:hypothetical protein
MQMNWTLTLRTLMVAAAITISSLASASDKIPQTAREEVFYYLKAIDTTGDGFSELFRDQLDGFSTVHGIVWWEVFGILLAAESALADFEDGDFAAAGVTLSRMAADQLIPPKSATSALSGAGDIANLAALPIKLSLNKFVELVNGNAFKLQGRLYQAARDRGLSHQQILARHAPSPDILYDRSSGYLLSVGDLAAKAYGARIPMAALVSREEVYDLLRVAYESGQLTKQVRRERDLAVRELTDYLSSRKASNSDALLFVDNFDDNTLSARWTATGNMVQEVDGVLKILNNETDKGGNVSGSFDLPSGGLSIIRKAKLHYSNAYSMPSIRLVYRDSSNVEKGLFSIYYGNMSYQKG